MGYGRIFPNSGRARTESVRRRTLTGGPSSGGRVINESLTTNTPNSAVMSAATIPSRAARALALTSASALCMFAATALAITVMGTVHRPGVILDIVIPVFHPKPVTHKAVMAKEAAPVTRIDKVEYAGRALIADPALIENSQQGPIPRIADDGRKPMVAYA